jgi:cyclin L
LALLLDAPTEVAQRAWNFLNDSMRTNVNLRFPPQVVATAAIWFAARLLLVKLPDNPPWYTLFDATLDDIEEIASVLADLYTRDKVQYIAVDEDDAKRNDLVALVSTELRVMIKDCVCFVRCVDTR